MLSGENMPMKKSATLLFSSIALLAAATAASAEKRCGWVENPTPGNYYLSDRDGRWEISAQGGYEAEGMDRIGDLSAGDYRATNGNYGYACGCATVKSDADSQRIIVIDAFEQKLLADCEADPNLILPDEAPQ